MDILIKNADIITCNENNKVIKNGCLGIKDGYIEYLGDNIDYLEDMNAVRVIDGTNKIVMPGLVNAHTHCAMTILRNFANDMPLEDWLFRHVFPAEAKLTQEDVYWGTLLGISEMVRSGTTTFADMYLYMDEVARAVSEAGVRANLSRSPLKFDKDGKSEAANEHSMCSQYYKDWNNKAEGRIKVYIEVHSVYLFDKENLIASANLARELNTGIHIHILETLKEREESIGKYGMNSAEICLETGVFDVPVMAAHCVHLSDSDVEILKNKGVNVVHNPTSNLKLGSGIARVPELLKRGINVSLGTDGAASNNNLNMFEELHIASLIHKGIHRDSDLLSAREVIRMATVNGAKAAGFEGITGTIENGMKADIIIIDTDKPHLCPVNDPVSAIVYSAQGADVDTVIVNGKIIMEKGEIKTIDEARVRHKVREIAGRILGTR
ncbi:MAG: amidohydrolase [Clostridiaceae bacterium]|nr:amidohydrolase [Clostridiaceae bacterium]